MSPFLLCVRRTHKLSRFSYPNECLDSSSAGRLQSLIRYNTCFPLAVGVRAPSVSVPRSPRVCGDKCPATCIFNVANCFLTRINAVTGEQNPRTPVLDESCFVLVSLYHARRAVLVTLSHTVEVVFSKHTNTIVYCLVPSQSLLLPLEYRFVFHVCSSSRHKSNLDVFIDS